MSLSEKLSRFSCALQQELFPVLEKDLGPLSERYALFVTVVEMVRPEAHLPCVRGLVGRPARDRAALACACIAKAVFNIATTRDLIERLEVDRRLYRLCGWSGVGRLPSEATFSRAFAEFAESALASRLHETAVSLSGDHVVGHISRAIRRRSKRARSLFARWRKRRRRASVAVLARGRFVRRSRAVWSGN